MPRRVRVERLAPGARFRFEEDARWGGYPYTVRPNPATYKGEGYFEAGERPVVIQRADGRYPRYGNVQGYFPVRNDEGKLVYYVVHPSVEVLVPTPSWVWLATALGVLGGVAGLYTLLTYVP